jgi:hypothetical protein
MNGKRMRLERIEAPRPARPPAGKPAAGDGDKPPPQDAAKVIRLPRKKKTDP